MKRNLWIFGLLLLASTVFADADSDPGKGAHLPSQAAADLIRQAAGTDGAFLAAGQVHETYKPSDLATLVEYPTDEIVVLRLSGATIRRAFERSVSLYPQPNSGFLQVSGFSVEFSTSAAPGKRILQVTAGGSPLDPGRTYTVAMPSSLGQGSLGYFKIWDKSKIASTLAGTTVESVLSGKPYAVTSPRWVSRS